MFDSHPIGFSWEMPVEQRSKINSSNSDCQREDKVKMWKNTENNFKRRNYWEEEGKERWVMWDIR